MDFMKKRKLNTLLNGFGSRTSTSASYPTSSDTDPGLESTPNTPPSNRNSCATADSDRSTIRIPASDDPMEMHYPPSSVPRTATTGDLDLLTKRRRLGLPESSLSSKDVNTFTNGCRTTVSNIVLRKWGGNKEKNSIFKPKYCPGDRQELLKRLASFQELTDWTPKPDPVNEVQWAKRGWICQGKERVRCTLCNKELVVKLNRKEVGGKEISVLVASEIEDALVDKYVELMVTSHQEDCLWRKRGCDDTLLRLPLSSPQTALQDLRKRYDELCARNAFLPYDFNLRLPENLDIDTILSQLPSDFFTVPPPPSTIPARPTPNRVALALAVLGWQGLSNARIGPVPNTASCHTCLRRLGLWMFKSKEIDPETNTVLVPAPMDHLDPLREHRFFCPWKNPEAQKIDSDATSAGRRLRLGGKDGAEKAGWEILCQVFKNESYLRNRNTPNKKGAHASGAPGTRPPQTPSRDGNVGSRGQDSPLTPGVGGAEDGEEDEEEDEKTRDAKDKERWARLRRVKSLFDTKKKGTKKQRKATTISRPGTSHSTADGPGDGTLELEGEQPAATEQAT